jgi:hypothetical protein
LKEYFIAIFVVKILLRVYSKVVAQKSKSTIGMTTFSMKDCLAVLAHNTDQRIDFGLWNIVPLFS